MFHPAQEDVAIGFTLRTFAGYEEARGRLPFARAYRENSLDVIAAALGPTHKETLLAIDLYCGSMMKQGYFEEAVAFYRSIILQVSGAGSERAATASTHIPYTFRTLVTYPLHPVRGQQD
tara:strand:- start:942 stop:1301 length:360 start_codon:yes stop_codon:yes gene_type:complete